MRAWPAPAQGLVASGVAPGGTLTPPITLSRSLVTTSGTSTDLTCSSTFSDGGTNSTAVARVVSFSPTVNFTGASKTGKVVLAYFNPTLTSQPTGNNAGISFSSALNSSTFPAIVAYNTADEDTNYERMEMSWGNAIANSFCFRIVKGGTGTIRNINFCYGGTSTQALVIPSAPSVEMILVSGVTGSAITNGRVSIGRAGTCTGTSGTHPELSIAGSPAPTSTSTLAWRGLQIIPTINYSNGTPGAGSVYCAYIAPVNTALPTGLNAGIALSSTASGLTGAIMMFNQSDETTNFEYVYQKFNTNVWEIGSVKGGTGTLRGLRFGISGNSLSFYGVTPVARPAAYTLTATVVASRTLNANASATAANNNSVIAQMIQDLQAVGLFQ